MTWIEANLVNFMWPRQETAKIKKLVTRKNRPMKIYNHITGVCSVGYVNYQLR